MVYLSNELIIEKLNSLHEHQMAKEIFVPLLKKKGLKGVKFTGGANEEGIDIEYYERSVADDIKLYTGIQFKKGNIKYSSKGSNNTVKEIKNQAEEAFAKDICEVNFGGVYHLFRFIVATTGEINEYARKRINKAKTKGEQTNISYWDGEKLANEIRKYYLDEFIDYFDINENEDIYEDENKEIIITSEYIEENYQSLVVKSRKSVRTFSSIQKEIVKAIIDNYFETDSYSMQLGDLLFELETQEDYIRNDLINMQNIGIIYIDEDYTISLEGNSFSLIQLAENIVEEIVGVKEYIDNKEEAKRIFYDVVSEF